MRTIKKSGVQKCVECRGIITGTLYRFAGGVACEKCVSAYYNGQDYPQATIAHELKLRAVDASSWQELERKARGRRDDDEDFD